MFSNVNPWNSKTALTLPFIQSKILQPYHESLSKKQFLWRKKIQNPLDNMLHSGMRWQKKGLQKVIASFCYKKRNQEEKNPIISFLHWTRELSSIKLSLQFKVCVKLQIRLYQCLFFSITQWGHNLYEMGFSFLYIFQIIKTRSFRLLHAKRF